MASSKVEICLKKKNPPRAQIFRHFRIENRNNKFYQWSSFANLGGFMDCKFFQN